MSVRELRHDNPSGRFSKSWGLSASVSFLSSPPPARSFTWATFLAVFDSRYSFFSPKPQETLATQAIPHNNIVIHKNYLPNLILGFQCVSLFGKDEYRTFSIPGTICTLAPLHGSPLQQSFSHLVIFTELEELQIDLLQHAVEVTHPLSKPTLVAPAPVSTAFRFALQQRSWLFKQDTCFVLFLQSSQLLKERQ